MSTQSQIDANRQNATKSTGPKTPEGKANSSRNAVKHGLTSDQLTVPHLEEKEEYETLLADLMGEFQPATPHEKILVERMAHNQWISLRALKLQTIFLDASLGDGSIHSDFGLLIRYHTCAQRAYNAAHAELIKARKQKEIPQNGFVSQTPAETPQPPAQTTPVAPLQPDPQPSTGPKPVATAPIPIEEIAKAA